MTSKPKVAIVMGSDSDLEIMREAGKALDGFGIDYEIDIASAHRSPARTSELARKAVARGIKVIIAGAGGAAHLAGVIAAETTLPVIGVPIPSVLNGLDSLLSTVQMPAGIPVATVAIGKAGATNAGILAAQILALSDPKLAEKLKAHKEKLAQGVEEKSRKLKNVK
jgi:phosphoribosylaminoimidazole carboxylase PurE protein